MSSTYPPSLTARSITPAVEEFSTLPQKQPFNSTARRILFLLKCKSSISDPASVAKVGAMFPSMTTGSSIAARIVAADAGLFF